MPSQLIPLTTTNIPRASLAQSAINQLAEARRRLIDAKAYADQAASGGDWAGMAAAFGCASQADAQALYNLLAGAVVAMTANDIDALIERVATS